MGKKVSGIKGMEDLHQPQQVRLWQWVESRAKQIFEAAGFQELRTPIVEDAGLFERSVGEHTDIVEKEMYTLEDRKGKRLALRPEGTASVVRAFVEHYTSHNIHEGRFYYLGPMYRYERPQKGRFRQFYQIGTEVFGSDHPLVDAELIYLGQQLFKELGLHDQVSLQLNSLGSLECRNRYREALKGFLEKVKGDFSEEARERLERNPLRLLDSKEEAVQESLAAAPVMTDFLSDESKAHFEEVQWGLKELEVPFELNPRIVRGLDYYEKTVFEWVGVGLGAQNAVAAGGRYNHLVKDLGGPDLPGVGFALGMERVVSLVPPERLSEGPTPRVYLIPLDETAGRELFLQLNELREAGAKVHLDLEGHSLKSKMRRAAKWKADWGVIRGPEERAKGVVVFRNMKESSQEEIPADELLSRLLSKFPTKTFLL